MRTDVACAAGEADVAAMLSSLGWSLLSASLSKPVAGVGVFVSPLSVFAALLLALNGAGPGSETQREMLQLLTAGLGAGGAAPACSTSGAGNLSEAQLNARLSALMKTLASNPDTPHPNISHPSLPDRSHSDRHQGQVQGGGIKPSTLLIANGIFTRSEVSAEYSASMASLFNATTRTVSSAQEINDWVNQSTRGEIPTLLDPGAPFDTVLANALYFKGTWRKPFNKRLTQPQVFHAPNGDRQVYMMRASFDRENRVQVETLPAVYRAVVLPYQDRQYSAVAVLPEPGVSLQDTIAALSSAAAHANRQLQTPAKTIVSMPKFRAEASLELKRTLEGLGMKAAFRTSANFSRLSPGLFISEVLHKTVVDVDEEGTVAAAVTGVVMVGSIGSVEPPVELTFDRPFLFIIRHVASGTPVFVGAVQAPPEAS